MGQATGIEWTDATWNPVVGCTKLSAGCKNCYAKTLHDQRHKAYHAGKRVPLQYAEPFEKVQLMPDRLGDPLSWKKPRKVFVNSVSDLFHEDIPDGFLDQVFAVMFLANRHTFQVLTKRAARMAEYLNGNNLSDRIHEAIKSRMGYDHPDRPAFNRRDLPLSNVWLGVSVENQATADERIPHLLRVPAAVHFLSLEPLLGPVKFSDVTKRSDAVSQLGKKALDGIHWVIVGGESGAGARPMHPDWARSLRDQCQAAGVPFFFKQWGELAYHEVRASDDGVRIVPPLPAEDFRGLQHVDGGALRPFAQNATTAEVFAPGKLLAVKVGKARSGRLLDGREWDEFPEPRA